MLDLPPQDAIVAVILVVTSARGGGPTQGAENLADLVFKNLSGKICELVPLMLDDFTKYTLL